MMKGSFWLRAAEVSIRRGGEGVAEQPRSRWTGSRGRNGRCGVTFQGILEWPSFSSQVPEFLQPLKKGPPAGNQMLNARSCGDGSYLSWYFISGLFVCQPDKNWGCLGRDRIWTEKKNAPSRCACKQVWGFFFYC